MLRVGIICCLLCLSIALSLLCFRCRWLGIEINNASMKNVLVGTEHVAATWQGGNGRGLTQGIMRRGRF